MATTQQKEQKKKDKEREWADVNEENKFVIHGGKVQCKYCSVPKGDFVVPHTPDRVLMQDVPWATIADNNGKVNFNFSGTCTHPSQKNPPCKAVISIGKWKNYSETMVNNDNALLVKSTIACNVSREDITVTHSGQVATLDEIEPMMKPQIKKAYWVTGANHPLIEKQEAALNNVSAISPQYGTQVKVVVETKYIENGTPMTITISAAHLPARDTPVPALPKPAAITVKGNRAETAAFYLNLLWYNEQAETYHYPDYRTTIDTATATAFTAKVTHKRKLGGGRSANPAPADTHHLHQQLRGVGGAAPKRQSQRYGQFYKQKRAYKTAYQRLY